MSGRHRHAGEEWVENATRVLEAAGYRKGSARRAVVELLGAQDCAVSVHDMEAGLRRRGRAIGRASIYRVLEQLTELRLVARLEVGQGSALYEAIRPDGEHHHHMVCDRCGRVSPFEDPELERTIERVARKVRFAVADHEVVLHGACEACRD